MIQCTPFGLYSFSHSSHISVPSLTSLATGFSEMTLLPAFQHFLMISGCAGIVRLNTQTAMSSRASRASRLPAAADEEEDEESEDPVSQ